MKTINDLLLTKYARVVCPQQTWITRSEKGYSVWRHAAVQTECLLEDGTEEEAVQIAYKLGENYEDPDLLTKIKPVEVKQ